MKEHHRAIPKEKRDAIVEVACEWLASGKALYRLFEADRQKGEDRELCNWSTFDDWQVKYPEYADKVARAREAGCQKLVEEIVEIADRVHPDTQRDKLRVHAREKAAQMLAPRRFGAKVDVTSGGEKLPAPATTSDNRIQALIQIAQQRLKDNEKPSIGNLMDD